MGDFTVCPSVTASAGATGAAGAAGAATTSWVGATTTGAACEMAATGAAVSPLFVLTVILISPISRLTSLAPDLATNFIRFWISFNSMVYCF